MAFTRDLFSSLFKRDWFIYATICNKLVAFALAVNHSIVMQICKEIAFLILYESVQQSKYVHNMLSSLCELYR